jgi:hypothetical protein
LRAAQNIITQNKKKEESMKNDSQNFNEPIELIEPLSIQWEISPEMTTLDARCTPGEIVRCGGGTE